MGRSYQRNRRIIPHGLPGATVAGTYHWEVVGTSGPGATWWIHLEPWITTFNAFMPVNNIVRGLGVGPVPTTNIKYTNGGGFFEVATADVAAGALELTGTSPYPASPVTIYIESHQRRLVTRDNLWNSYWSGLV